MPTQALVAHPRRSPAKLGALAALMLLGLASTAHAEQLDFYPGSLIIPMQSTYQSSCGTVSAYGLVWRLLQSNEAGHFNAAHPVTVYWTIDTKQSINRCSPSNLHDAVSLTSTPNKAGTSWNDGCDVTIPDNATTVSAGSPQPVTLAALNTALPTGGIYPTVPVWNRNTQSVNTSGTSFPYAYPQYPLKTLSAASGFNRARYLGGPFMIAAADVPNVVAFLQQGDAHVSPAELLKFIDSSKTGCDTSTLPSTAIHYVRVHQLLVTAHGVSVARKLNAVPPKIALVNLPKYDGTSNNGVSTGILNVYLQNAGLDDPANCASSHSCYGGCMPNSYSYCSANGSTPLSNLGKNSGLIYDNIDGNLDIHSTATDTYGLINKKDAKGKLLYKVLWAPHWELTSIAGPAGAVFKPIVDGPDTLTTTEADNVRNNVSRFTDNQSTGLMDECASIGTFEDSPSLPAGNRPGVTTANILSSTGWTINQLAAASYMGRNCTDPDYNGTASCMLYPAPSDPFSQIGDYVYFMVAGVVEDFVPNLAKSSVYMAGEQRLAVSYPGYAGQDFTSNPLDPTNILNVAPSGDKNRTAFTWGQKGGDSKKATVLYLGGHSYSTTSVPGNRVVLNTLLNIGFDPVSQERSFTTPIGYVDPNGSDTDGSRVTVLGTTYDAVTGYPAAMGVRNFTIGQQSQWVFPYYPGHLRDHSLVGGNTLATGESSLGSGTLWDAEDVLPLPGARNIFTYVGGSETSPSHLSSYDNNGNTTSIYGPATNGVAQTGWTPSAFDYTAMQSTATCVDVMKYSTSLGNLTFIPGSDGICDLQQMLQLTQPTMQGIGIFRTVNNTATLAAMASTKTVTQQMIQKIKGYCISTSTGDDTGTPILQPSDSQCNLPEDTNRARLGAFVSSSPAIIPVSSYLVNDKRPTVAYAAGWDGQLHAFYVSGGTGYSGPSQVLHYPNKSAASAFVTPLTTTAGILPGQELWSYLPASQLPWMFDNNARVDISPVYGEYSVDLVGSGSKEYHTLLAAAIGAGNGREIFTFDVTNPLRPVLLWDVVGSLAQSSNYPTFSPVTLANTTTVGLDDKSYKWFENTSFFSNPLNYGTDLGLLRQGLYNYSELGASTGLTIGQINGGATALFVTSNSYGTDMLGNAINGVEVFAIDAVTGQKLWQWQESYASSFPYNNAPAQATITGPSGFTDTVWVGDLEGKLWELDAATGRNRNSVTSGGGCTVLTPCAIPAFKVATSTANPQPISTNLAVGIISPTSTGGLASVAGKTFLAFGTAGYDWVEDNLANANPVQSNMHMLIIDPAYKAVSGNPKLGGSTWSAGAALTYNIATGMYSEVSPPFPVAVPSTSVTLNGSTTTVYPHIYGSLTIAGTDLYLAVANGAIGDDIMNVNPLLTGESYVIHTGSLSGATLTQLSTSNANFGGVAVVHASTGAGSTDFVVGQELAKISNTAIINSVSVGSSTAQSSLNPMGGKTKGQQPGLMLNFIRRLWSSP